MVSECPQLQSLPANIRKFWEEKQQTLHDTLVRFSYGIMVEATDVVLREKSGLLYLMQQNLWFEDFPKSSIFTSLFQQSTTYTKTHISFSLTGIAEVRLVTPRELGDLLGCPQTSGRFWKFFQWFTPKPTTLFLSGKQVSGQKYRCAFREVDDPEAWYEILSREQRS